MKQLAVHKPGYHIVAPYGWMNDPNGMFQHAGRTHVFFQYNPDAPVWDSPYWGHVVSEDLAHWTWLPVALRPDAWYDKDGVFSGSATLLDDGMPAMLYTGVMNRSDVRYYRQMQAAATPANLSDPDLVAWTKTPAPIITELPPGGDYAQFRDPTTAWRVPATTFNGKASDPAEWVTVVGLQDDCVGSAALYRSGPGGFIGNWSYAGTLFSQLSEQPELIESCWHHTPEEAPAGAKNFGGSCDQFGPCRMWECPDVYELPAGGGNGHNGNNGFDNGPNGTTVVKYSDQLQGRTPWAADWYVLGNAPLNWTAAPKQDEYDVFSATLNSVPYSPRLLDYGSVYASKSFALADGRRGWLGWVYETSANCTEVCARGTDFTSSLGWQGTQTLLREVTYDPDTRELLLYPVAETALLRSKELYVGTTTLARGGRGTTLWAWDEASAKGANASSSSTGQAATATAAHHQGAGGAPLSAVAPSSASHGRQLEVQLNFTLFTGGAVEHAAGSLSAQAPGALQPFQVGAVLHTGAGSTTTIYLNGSVSIHTPNRTATAGGTNATAEKAPAPPALAAKVVDMSVWVDTRRAGGVTNGTIQGGPVTLPSNFTLPAHQLTLSIYVDHSVLEVYANRGRGRVTARIYPEDLTAAWGVSAFADFALGDLQLAAEVWEMDSCWLEHPSLPVTGLTGPGGDAGKGNVGTVSSSGSGGKVDSSDAGDGSVGTLGGSGSGSGSGSDALAEQAPVAATAGNDSAAAAAAAAGGQRKLAPTVILVLAVVLVLVWCGFAVTYAVQRFYRHQGWDSIKFKRLHTDEMAMQMAQDIHSGTGLLQSPLPSGANHALSSNHV